MRLRDPFRSGASELGSAWAAAIVVVGACVVLLALAAAVGRLTGRAFEYFSVDPAATVGESAYIGFLSHVGVLLLWTAAVACALAALVVSRREASPRATALFAAAAANAYVALDDLFLLHEDVYPELGVPERVSLVVYAIAGAAFLWRLRDVVARHDWPLLALAVALLLASVGVDLAEDWHPLEDAFKLVGLALWSTYFVRLALVSALVAVVSPGGAATRSGARRGEDPRG